MRHAPRARERHRVHRAPPQGPKVHPGPSAGRIGCQAVALEMRSDPTLRQRPAGAGVSVVMRSIAWTGAEAPAMSGWIAA